MKPIPILFTIPNFITAGSGIAMLNFVSRLDLSLFAPAVAVLKKGGKLDAEVERLGFPLIEAPFTLSARPYPTLLMRARQAAQVFRPYQFALWHSFHYSDDYTEPLVARFSGARGWVYTKKNMSWGSNAWFLRSLFAARIAVQNPDILDRFLNRWPLQGKARLIPPGVDAQKYHPGVPARLGLRQQLGISADAPLIACVAELVSVKGHPTLLQALAEVPGAHLLLAGRPMDQAYVAGLEAQVATLGIKARTHFLGGVADIPALLAESDVFVLPTVGRGRMEGCPVALMEAMACGKACLATDIPGSHFLIKQQENGLLVPTEDPAAMAGSLRTMLADPDLRRKLGQAARQSIEAYFNVERETAEYTQLYQEILGAAGA